MNNICRCWPIFDIMHKANPANLVIFFCVASPSSFPASPCCCCCGFGCFLPLLALLLCLLTLLLLAVSWFSSFLATGGIHQRQILFLQFSKIALSWSTVAWDRKSRGVIIQRTYGWNQMFNPLLCIRAQGKNYSYMPHGRYLWNLETEDDAWSVLISLILTMRCMSDFYIDLWLTRCTLTSLDT